MLYLVRHGRTDANARGLLQGRLDPSLDEVGRAQARAIAGMIGQVDEVFASPLVRARETAEHFDRPVTLDARWLELAYGVLEGTPAADVAGEIWQQWRDDPDFATPGGESFGSLNARVREACGELIGRIEERRVVVVSHVSPIKAAVAWALNAPLDIMFHCHLAQASVCQVSIGKFGPILHSFNEQAGPIDGSGR